MNRTKLALKKSISSSENKKMLFNHSFWESKAQKYKTTHDVTWGDINMLNLEIKNVSKFITKKDLVLDAGCSNGYSTFEIAKKTQAKTRAFDYSQESIKNAIKAQKTKDKKRRIYFYHGNILNIDEQSNTFDKVYAIRVLVNLLSWRLQKQAILEMHRVLKKGGLYLLSEAFFGSMQNLNKLRAAAELPPLKEFDFNLFLREERFENFVKKYFDIIEIRKFSSIYYAASRFIRYLTQNKKMKDSFVNEINNYFAKFDETDSSGDFGINKLYVLRKK